MQKTMSNAKSEGQNQNKHFSAKR